MVYYVLFGLFAALTIGSAAYIALTKNLIYAAFSLFAALLGLAGLYVFAGADFPAAAQIIVYVGGVLILVLFGVMLTIRSANTVARTDVVNFFPGVLASGGLLFLLLYAFRDVKFVAAKTTESVSINPNNIERIGQLTLTEYLLPFEVISVFLLAVLIAAAYISRK